MSTKLRVYLASPYTSPDPCANTNAAIQAGQKLMELGFVPFVPHLSHFWHTVIPANSWDDWMKWCLEWVGQCDAVLRIGGESKGADIEVEHAALLGIPVFENFHDLREWRESR